MSINGRAKAPPTPGFIISMAGAAEIPFGLFMALFLDDFLTGIPPVIAGITVGQLIGLVMMAGGVVIFLYGRHLGWTPRGHTGSIGKSGANSNNNPVKRM